MRPEATMRCQVMCSNEWHVTWHVSSYHVMYRSTPNLIYPILFLKFFRACLPSNFESFAPPATARKLLVPLSGSSWPQVSCRSNWSSAEYFSQVGHSFLIVQQKVDYPPLRRSTRPTRLVRRSSSVPRYHDMCDWAVCDTKYITDSTLSCV